MGNEISKLALTEEERACLQRLPNITLKVLDELRKSVAARDLPETPSTDDEPDRDKAAPPQSEPLCKSYALGTPQNPVMFEESDEEEEVTQGTTNEETGRLTDTIESIDECHREATTLTAEVQTRRSLQDPVVIEAIEEDEAASIIIETAQNDDLVRAARLASEEREEAMPTRGGRKAVYRPTQGAFRKSPSEWAGTRRPVQRTWSGANRINKYGQIREPACQRCRRDHAEGREADPCRTWRAGGFSKCQYCTLLGAQCRP